MLAAVGGCGRDVADEVSDADRVVYVRLARPSCEIECFQGSDPAALAYVAAAVQEDLDGRGLGWGVSTKSSVLHQVLFIDAAEGRVVGDFKIVDDRWVLNRHERLHGDGRTVAALRDALARGDLERVAFSELEGGVPWVTARFWRRPKAPETQPDGNGECSPAGEQRGH